MQESAQIDELALWKMLQAERNSPAGVTLWLTMATPGPKLTVPVPLGLSPLSIPILV